MQIRHLAPFANLPRLPLSKPDVVFLQETWHLSNACEKLGTLHKDYTYFEQSGIDSNSTIILGRPKGDLAILFKRSLAGYMSKLETNSHRVCAAHMKRDCIDILIINAYMPCDNRRCNYVNPEYQSVIESIDVLIAQHPESEYRARSGIMSIVLFPAIILLHMHPISST